MKYSFILIASLFITSFVFAQESGVIEGVVSDASINNEPILFATATINETEASTTTDFRGRYFFKDLKPGTYTVSFNFLGYKTITKQIEVSNAVTVLNTALKPTNDINFDAIELTSN